MSYRTWARLCAVLATAAALLAPIPMAGQGDGADAWTVGRTPWGHPDLHAPMGFRGAGETLHLVERFTRVAPDMILYRATIENPVMYSRPWTIETPWIQAGEADNQIFESACHEGNYGLTGILAGARATEQGGSE